MHKIDTFFPKVIVPRGNPELEAFMEEHKERIQTADWPFVVQIENADHFHGSRGTVSKVLYTDATSYEEYDVKVVPPPRNSCAEEERSYKAKLTEGSYVVIHNYAPQRRDSIEIYIRK